MYFNLGPKIERVKSTSSNPAKLWEEIPLENGVVKEVHEYGVTFSKRESIDGLNYLFTFSKERKGKDWRLGFSTEHGMFVTNKGLGVYKQIIDNIVTLINTVRLHEKVKEFSFFGADEEIRIDELDAFKKSLKEKKENGKYLFDNFSYIIQHGLYKKSVHVNNGMVLIEESGYRTPNIKERIKKVDTSWNRITRMPVEEFIDNQFELKEILKEKEIMSSLMKHIGVDFTFNRDTNKKDMSKLRVDLYERTIKQRFPEYKFKREGNAIKFFIE